MATIDQRGPHQFPPEGGRRNGYRQRSLVERFFNKLNHFGQVATCFDKSARNFLAAAVLASTRLWMRTYESRA
jgi:transposase